MVGVVLLLAACTASPAASPPGSTATPAVAASTAPASTASHGSPVPTPTRTPTPSPTETPTAADATEHPSGPADVVLSLDLQPDYGIGEIGFYFYPGIDFTLYGDGTVVARDATAKTPPADGAIQRGSPFLRGQLDEAQVQALLEFAIGEGGLGKAKARYEVADTDDFKHSIFTIRADGLDKRVEVIGSNSPFQALEDRLLDVVTESSMTTQTWQADRFHGQLYDAASMIEVDVLPQVKEAGSLAWPWPDISPADFAHVASDFAGTRTLSAAEAAIAGLSDHGGVIERVYLRDPKGSTVYAFSMWPLAPDATSAPGVIRNRLPSGVAPGAVAMTTVASLRVRSEPRVSEDSFLFEPLLPAGTTLYVVEGPVSASGYSWSEVVPLESLDAPAWLGRRRQSRR